MLLLKKLQNILADTFKVFLYSYANITVYNQSVQQLHFGGHLPCDSTGIRIAGQPAVLRASGAICHPFLKVSGV